MTIVPNLLLFSATRSGKCSYVMIFVMFFFAVIYVGGVGKKKRDKEKYEGSVV